MNVQRCVTLLDTEMDVKGELMVPNGVNEVVLQVYIENGTLEVLGMVSSTIEQNPYCVQVTMPALNVSTREVTNEITESGIYIVELEGVSSTSILFTDEGDGSAHVLCKIGNSGNRITSSMASGGSGTDLEVATDEQVDEMLDGVFGDN